MSDDLPRYSSIRELPSGSQEKASGTKTREQFNYLDYPNGLESIPDTEFNADRANLLMAFNLKHNKLSIEDRAFPLLRPSPPTVNPKPGFISFIGDTGSGKSWILRSLKRGEDHSKYPLPLVAPGRQPNNFASTSADVHLYADSASWESVNPILFLDFEGLRGSTVPSSLKARIGSAIAPSNSIDSPRYGLIQDAYPRIAYAFSNCIIFVVSEQVGKARATAKLLTKYSNCGVKASRHLGFKPSLFVVFNQITSHDLSPSSWSIDDSTRTFLAIPDANGLVDHYHKIFVINIPQLTLESSGIVIDQLDKLGYLLREQHSEACNRRVAFGLDFSPDQITAYLTRSLRVFTKHKDAVFDWLEQSLDQRELPTLTKIAEDIWIHFYQHFRDSQNISPVKAFHDSLEIFHSHFIFCVRLHLARHPPIGRAVGFIPRRFEETMREVDQAISFYVPCNGTKGNLHCDSIQRTHDVDFHTCGPNRWKGTFKHATRYEHSLKDKVLKSLPTSGSECRKLSLKDSESVSLLSKIRSVYSCVGCLNYPSTFLSCDHGFCEECVEDIAGTKDLHRLVTIKCPYCQHKLEEQHFSPRFLPHTAGYRILSLDGGVVRGMAQVKILRAIEMRCFDIPIVHLFDFFIGTSIGGQLALAIASRESPLTLSNAATEFRNLVAQEFKPKSFFKPLKWQLLKAAVQGSTKYNTTVLETSLKGFFEESPRLLSARTPLSPHVAVTAASRNKFEKRVIPNYMRRPSGDADDETRLVLSTKPEQCMPTWVAARCTVGAYPHFKAFEWKGEYLLDGGFAANCPAELAFDETRCLWPNRKMDVLVSVGTGTPRANDQSSSRTSQPPHADNYLLNIAQTSIEVVTNAEKLWTEFEIHHKSEKDRIIRLQPTYDEVFPLDAVKKLDVISNEVEAWLKTNKVQIDAISNQLIASLFFFKPSALDSQSRTQSGSIECRLPPDLFERQAMVNALIKVAATSQLFTVDIPGRSSPGEDISGALGFLEDVSPGAELSIPVTISHLPLVGGTTIDIKLFDIFGNGESRYSISGCPFTIRE